MKLDLTNGSILKSLILFSLPMILGNILQQFYNIADTLIVGQVLGKDALAAVGSAYSLMTFLTSVFLGLSMGAGALFSIYYGKQEKTKLKDLIAHGFLLISFITIIINILVFIFLDQILIFLKTPTEIYASMHDYLFFIFMGLIPVSIYNFIACLLKALGNSLTPLYFLAFSTVLNIGLDLLFVITFTMGIKGAAIATIISQFVSAIGILIYFFKECKELIPSNFRYNHTYIKELLNMSSLTCLQQSTMNFGILLIQRLINSFGAVVMAGFAAAIKIDTFAYLPVQDFGNAFSSFVAINYGANKKERIKKGFKIAIVSSCVFAILISIIVNVFSFNLMNIFISKDEIEVINEGIKYLRIEGSFYFGIAILFLLYGYYRAIKKPFMSFVLTVISLGLRVVLAYIFAPITGTSGIYMAIPIGWIIADAFGLCYKKLNNAKVY